MLLTVDSATDITIPLLMIAIVTILFILLIWGASGNVFRVVSIYTDGISYRRILSKKATDLKWNELKDIGVGYELMRFDDKSIYFSKNPLTLHDRYNLAIRSGFFARSLITIKYNEAISHFLKERVNNYQDIACQSSADIIEAKRNAAHEISVQRMASYSIWRGAGCLVLILTGISYFVIPPGIQMLLPKFIGCLLYYFTYFFSMKYILHTEHRYSTAINLLSIIWCIISVLSVFVDMMFPEWFNITTGAGMVLASIMFVPDIIRIKNEKSISIFTVMPLFLTCLLAVVVSMSGIISPSFMTVNGSIYYAAGKMMIACGGAGEIIYFIQYKVLNNLLKQ